MSGENMSWLPLESNPDVMNKFLQGLGVSKEWQLCDVFGLDADVLSTVPRPVAALLLLFPTSDKYVDSCKQQEDEIKEKGQTVSDALYYMKQSIKNACGTVALIHCIANNLERIKLDDGALKQFLDETASMDPEERGQKLMTNEGIAAAHQENAQEGQTEAPDSDQPVDYHFVAFVSKEGDLYELDGRKEFPINHGSTSDDSFLEDAAGVCQKYMERDPEEIRFTVVALTAA